MSTPQRRPAPPSSVRRPLPDHPVRVQLLDLLAEKGTVTSTQAARRLGHSSGLCSFHLRQLARHGLIEEAPHDGGRARPWRLRWGSGGSREGVAERPGEFDVLARGLEDESYRYWLAHREEAPPEWRRDEAFSTVLHLTPREAAELADGVRALLARYEERGRRPAEAVAVAAVARVFPLLPGRPQTPGGADAEDAGDAGGAAGAGNGGA